MRLIISSLLPNVQFPPLTSIAKSMNEQHMLQVRSQTQNGMAAT